MSYSASQTTRPVHLVIGVDICGPEVDDDINDEHDVDDEIHHVEGGTGVTTGLHGCFLLVTRGKDDNRVMRRN